MCNSCSCRFLVYEREYKLLFLTMQVPFSRSSLNHDDVFILDTKDKIFQFNGASSNIQERAKALEVIQFLKDKYHDGVCDVAIVGKGTYIYVLNDFILLSLLILSIPFFSSLMFSLHFVAYHPLFTCLQCFP